MADLLDKALEELEGAFEKLKTSGTSRKVFEEKGEESFDKALEEIEKFAKANSARLGEGGGAFVDETLILLKGGKSPFLKLTNLEFASMVNLWGNDKEAEARRNFLAREADFEERQAAIRAAGDAVYHTQKAREAQLDAIGEVFKAIGKKGLKLVAAAVLPMVSGLL